MTISHFIKHHNHLVFCVIHFKSRRQNCIFNNQRPRCSIVISKLNFYIRGDVQSCSLSVKIQQISLRPITTHYVVVCNDPLETRALIQFLHRTKLPITAGMNKSVIHFFTGPQNSPAVRLRRRGSESKSNATVSLVRQC